MNPDSEYYLRELAGKFNVSPRHISLELQNLKNIDLMIIGDISGCKISSAMIQSGNELNKVINFNIFSCAEFSSRLKSNDHFINSIYKEAKLFIIGDQDDFERLGKK